MITLYTWKTPNGRKVPIMLEELGWEYRTVPIDLSKGEQHAPDFLALSPNNKIPALVDDVPEGGPVRIFESGAILQYLAEKSGRFLPASGPERYTVLEWLHWQIGGLGPMLGQLGYFANRAPEQVPLAIDRFKDECGRLIRVMNGRLAEANYLGGDYSIADMACYPWTVAATTMLKVPLASALEHAPAVQSWLDRVGARPAVQRGMAVLQN